MKKTVVTLCSAMLLLYATQGAVNAQPLSPVVPPPVVPPVVVPPVVVPPVVVPPVVVPPITPATEKARTEEALEATKEALEKLSNAGGKGAITKPLIPKMDTSQGTVLYTTVIRPTFDQAVWVESPAISRSATVLSWGFSVLQGSRRITQVDLPGFEDNIFVLLFSLPNRSGSQQVEVKGGEKYQFRVPIRQFVIKRKNRATGKVSVGLHYTGSGKTKLGVYPVNN
ncbi:MAG: hypothetical protein D3921_14180 [Candidatus Electrothrix sp. AW1]|nr:hypothetical protein [Candidatus Electrothrix sp. AX1]MCI5183642.1 hypothetical protein [Candidatus Electrothrix gigas]